MLAAGIDVFSTVNVQHLESLNDQVAELTGVRVRETFPDPCSPTADEVVLVDVTPEALIERLRAGKVYPPERVAGRAQRLLPDREPRGAARGRAAPGRRGRRGQAARARAAARARRAPGRRPGGAAGGRRAAARARHAAGRRRSGSCGARGARRSASAPSSTSSVLAARREPSADEAEQLDALRRLGSLLGAHGARRGGRRRGRGRRARRARARHAPTC